MATEHEQTEPEALTEEEVEQQEAEPLPDREVMSILPIEPGPGPAKFIPVPPLDV